MRKVIALLAALSLGGIAAAQAQTELKFGHVGNPGSLFEASANAFAARANAKLQEQGLDTVEANLALGLQEDMRDYRAAAEMLLDLGVWRVRLLTNNPAKIEGLERYGVEVVERIPLGMSPNSSNLGYLRTKREKMGHPFPKPMTLEVAGGGSGR